MPLILATLLSGLISIVGTLAGRVLVALGIGVVAYAGIGSLLGGLIDDAVQNLSGLPADLYGLMAFLKVGNAINIISSAILARLTLQGLTGDTMKRWVLK